MDSILEKFPNTIEKAVEGLVNDMTFGEKTRIVNMSQTRLIEFHKSYGGFIRMRFRLPGNDPLMESCRSISGLIEISGVQASYIILKELWKKLQNSNVLKIVR